MAKTTQMKPAKSRTTKTSIRSITAAATTWSRRARATLDARGHLNVEFQVPQADENDTSDYSYRLEAQVTDAARRTIDGAGSFVATRGTIVADADPDRYVYNKGDVAKIRRDDQRLRRPAGFRESAAPVRRAHLDQEREAGRRRRVFIS